MTTKIRAEGGDAGLRAIDDIYQYLQIEDKWSLPEHRGFSWWGGNLRQHVWADEPVKRDGEEVVRLHARTDLFREIKPSRNTTDLLAFLMSFSALSGLIRNPLDPSRIQLASSVFACEDNRSWVLSLFKSVVAIQTAAAHILAAQVPGLFDVKADNSCHMKSGFRNSYDSTLDAIRVGVAPDGEMPSKYAGPAMTRLLSDFRQMQTVPAYGDESGIEVEYPFLAHASLVELRTEDPHPRMGNGLMATLKLPEEETDPAMSALALNEMELTDMTGAQFLGSWCATPDGRLAFVSYFPNSLYQDDLLPNVFRSMANRARWIAESVYGDDWDRREADRQFAKG